MNLITPTELAKLLKDDKQGKVQPVDASWHMPATERSGHAEFKERRLLGACYWDS